MKKGINLTVNTHDIDRISIGGRLYDALFLGEEMINFHTILKFKTEEQERIITIRESDLKKLIQLTNPNIIKDFRIKFINE